MGEAGKFKVLRLGIQKTCSDRTLVDAIDREIELSLSTTQPAF
jgi:hypothetical protein